MPRAEIGTTKHLANRMKSKGLQRLRWYCTPCHKQCRDENGFKCHVNSESHVRQMQMLGEDTRKAINEYSNQFQRAFLQQLRTAHGTKPIHINHFYQEYIADKQHIHMNATCWPSLTEFAKYLGREGFCRVQETDKGLHISWIDNSPEALRRQDTLKKRERMDRGDEEREEKLIQEQIDRANETKTHGLEDATDLKARCLERQDSQRLMLNFNTRTSKLKFAISPRAPDGKASGDELQTDENLMNKTNHADIVAEKQSAQNTQIMRFQRFRQVKTKNIFRSGEIQASATKKVTAPRLDRGMSEVERIAKEGLVVAEHKRDRDVSSIETANGKRPRY